MDFYEPLAFAIYLMLFVLGFSMAFTAMLWAMLKVWKGIITRLGYWGDFLAYVRYRSTNGGWRGCTWVGNEETEWKAACSSVPYTIPFAKTFAHCPFCGKPIRIEERPAPRKT